jgi:hypothetical protein
METIEAEVLKRAVRAVRASVMGGVRMFRIMGWFAIALGGMAKSRFVTSVTAVVVIGPKGR